MTGEELREAIRSGEARIGEVYRGNPEAVRLSMLTLLAGGHLLIEDVPGIGKTTLALALAKVFALEFRRIQMTADLLPADLIGVSVYDGRTGTFRFHPGPVFAQVLLVDELNRATPKTQSALLEAMAEGAVSVEGETRPLPQPYVVLATQNPVEQLGTFPLPESQLDRFLMRIRLGYPAREEELALVLERRYGARVEHLEPVLDGQGVLAARRAIDAVALHEAVAGYVVAIAAATREHPEVLLGVSPRGSLALAQVARARAWLEGRTYVTPEDVYAVAVPVLAHRILVRGDEGWIHTELQESLMREILDGVPVPV